MNQMRLIVTTVVLASHILFSSSCARTDTSIGSSETTLNQETLQFTLQHSFNKNKPLPKETINIPLEKLEANPSLLLSAIRENFSQHLANQERPLQIHSQLNLVLLPELKKTMGELPTISIDTDIQKDGSGNSAVTVPANKLEVTEADDNDKTSIDWKKMTAQFSFTDQFKEITSAIQWLGLNLTSQKEGSISIGKSEFAGKFDINWIPSKLMLKLPIVEVVDPEEGVFKLTALNFDLNTQVANNGLELGNLTFEVGKIQYTDEDGLPFSIKNITFNADSKLETEVVNSSVNSNIGQITLPKEFAEEAQPVEMSYLANFAFRRLDAEALLALQKTARELQTQTQDSMMAGMALFGQFMAVAPKLLARSPEIALTQLTITTPKGNIEGKANLLLNGKKVTSLMEQEAWLNALQAQLNLNIGEDLLTKLLMLEEEDAETVEQEIQSLLKDKLLVKKGKNYEIVASFQDNKLTINGQETPLSQFLGGDALQPEEELPLEEK